MVDNKLRQLARILSNLQGGRWEGAVIVRAEWSAGRESAENTPALTVLKDRHALVTVCCRAEDEQLLVTMMLCGREPAKPLAKDSEVCAETAGNVRFSAAAIQEFTKSVGDTNRIHQGKCPVIPGLMLMESLLMNCPSNVKNLTMRFMQPAYAGAVEVDWQEGIIRQQGRITAQFQCK